METTTETETTVTTTEIPTTTAEPLPYDLNHLVVPSVSRKQYHIKFYNNVFSLQSVVFLIRPQNRVEGSYPLIVPVTDEVIIETLKHDFNLTCLVQCYRYNL